MQQILDSAFAAQHAKAQGRTVSSIQASMLIAIEKAFKTLRDVFYHVAYLERVLDKKRDPDTHTQFLAAVLDEFGGQNITTQFRLMVERALVRSVSLAQRGFPSIFSLI